jgi:hypothetical protein
MDRKRTVWITWANWVDRGSLDRIITARCNEDCFNGLMITDEIGEQKGNDAV